MEPSNHTTNQTTVIHFILCGLSSDPRIQMFLFLVFLVIYLVTLLGNMLIILVIRTGPQLHTPMYFFLNNLAFLDICYSSVSVPRLLVDFLREEKTVSVNGCIAQMFFIFMFSCMEVLILAAMAYDRYAAICDPLRYTVTMNKEVCCQLVGGAWTMGFLYALINTLPLSELHFCGPSEIRHFICELPSILDLSCTEIFTSEVVFFTSAAFIGIMSFSFTVNSYIHIIATILRIPSKEGKRKAFSTCSSHLIVVVLWYGTGLFRYMRPSSASSVVLDRLSSIQYSILTPMFNPIIYSLKNKEVNIALGKILGRYSFSVSHST
uniref:Olfactory receptor n=1 Tax=Pelusios castaneus TaxID=367368 RepID=A0A8C8RZB0_9SAUR